MKATTPNTQRRVTVREGRARVRRLLRDCGRLAYAPDYVLDTATASERGILDRMHPVVDRLLRLVHTVEHRKGGVS